VGALSINLRARDRLVVVVGAGRVAARKAATLLRAGATVRMIAPEVDAAVRKMHGPRLEVIERRYEEGDLRGALLVIAATNDDEINAKICLAARAACVLCSNAGEPSTGDFSLPASLHRGAVTVTVDTGGASPNLAKRILEQIDARLDPQLGAASQTLKIMRSYIRTAALLPERGDVLREVAGLPLPFLASMNQPEAQDFVDRALRRRRGIRAAATEQTATCASRGSPLALAQTRTITSRLAEAGVNTRLLTIATRGDLMPNRPLSSLQAENIFVKEIETALLEGRADYAVHSCKDLPSILDRGLRLVAISEREDPRDAFCSERFASFDALPIGARVGTSSVRRRAQLAALRQDLDYCDCRGNVDTRLRKLRAGDFDAIVLAMAGMVRLGERAAYTVPFEPDELVPAVAQGALAIEMRAEDGDLAATIRATINDARSETAIVCERAALSSLGGGCNAPIGIHAQWKNETLEARGIVLSADGARFVSARLKTKATDTAQAIDLGKRLAAQLQACGAERILEEPSVVWPLIDKLILLPRTQKRPSRIAQALEEQGACVVQIRSAEEAPQALGERAPDMIVFPSSGAVEVVVPLLAAWQKSAFRPAVVAMGPLSAKAAARRGLTADRIAEDASVDSLLAAVRQHFAKDPSPAR